MIAYAAGKVDMILEGATGAIDVTNWTFLVDLLVSKKEGQCQSMERPSNQQLDEQWAISPKYTAGVEEVTHSNGLYHAPPDHVLITFYFTSMLMLSKARTFNSIQSFKRTLRLHSNTWAVARTTTTLAELTCKELAGEQLLHVVLHSYSGML